MPIMIADAPNRSREPSLIRVASVLSVVGLVVATIFFGARRVAGEQFSPLGLLISVGGGVLAALLIGSAGEWVVHRYIMHRRLRPRPLSVPYDLHHRAHHWIQYPPNEYLHEDRVQRVPVASKIDRVCTTWFGRVLTAGSHVAFYSFFALALAVVPANVITGNSLFAAVITLITIVEIYLFVRVHDAVHHPGLSRLERFRWFRFLDRHHYIHHVDNRANTNFLLPLCDFLMGVLRRELSQRELAVWPSYEEARRNVVRPTFDDHGVRIQTTHTDPSPDLRKTIAQGP